MRRIIQTLFLAAVACNVAVSSDGDGSEDPVIYSEVMGGWTGSVGAGSFKLEIMDRLDPVVRVVWLRYKNNTDRVPQRFCQWQGATRQIRYQSAIFDSVKNREYSPRNNVPNLVARSTSDGLVLLFKASTAESQGKKPLELTCSGVIGAVSDCQCTAR